METLPLPPQPLPPQQVQAWINLAISKNALVEDLTKRELGLQAILLDKDKTLAIRIAEYKKSWGEMSEARKAFTNKLDEKLIQPLMAYEKRASPTTNTQFADISQQEFDERKATAKKLQDAQDLATETAAFKAHFINEFERLAFELRNKWSSLISQAYRDALAVKTPPDGIIPMLDILKKALADHQIETPKKFTRTLIDQDAAVKIYNELPKPQIEIGEAYKMMDEKFEMYSHDLGNAEAAIETEAQSHATEMVKGTQALLQTQAANVLITSAETVVLPPDGFKGITQVSKIRILDNSESWILQIIGTFISNYAMVLPKIKNRKLSQITVAQMAAALDAAGVTVKGVEYEKSEK